MWLIIGLFIGAMFGFFIACLCQAASERNETNQARYWKREALKWCDKTFVYVRKLAEGAMIELPCRVGDTAYIVDTEQGTIEESKVLSIQYTVPEHEYYIQSERLMFYNEDVGVDVFFSPSEAEAKLTT